MKTFQEFVYSEMAAGHVKAQSASDKGKFELETRKQLIDLKNALENPGKEKYGIENVTNVRINEPDEENEFPYLTGSVPNASGKIVGFKIAFPQEEDWTKIQSFDIIVDGKKVEGLKYAGIAQPASYIQYSLRQALYGKKGGGAGQQKATKGAFMRALEAISKDPIAMTSLSGNKNLEKLKELILQMGTSEEED